MPEKTKRYNLYSQHLRELFDCKVYKVTLDAGFSCPNRDGTLSTLGCIYCDEGGSFSQAQESAWPIQKQLEIGMNKLSNRFKAKRFISYFQAYTNTYLSPEQLKLIYDQALCFEDVVGLSIATRPDCVTPEIIELVQSYAKNYYVWLEYGLQSIHNKSLKLINRGHAVDDFYKAYAMTRKYGPDINVCAHVILGLPGETKTDMILTAQKLSELGIDGAKIHLLCVLKNTTLEKIYLNGDFEPLNQQEYVTAVADFLEHLSPSITIHRMAGNGLKKILVAPRWLSKKFELINQIDHELEQRNSYQGKALN
jgi:radical SAM protein (TIGR01212 family)